MPYYNKLANEYRRTTEWLGVAHPSLPNYLAIGSGVTDFLKSKWYEEAGTVILAWDENAESGLTAPIAPNSRPLEAR